MNHGPSANWIGIVLAGGSSTRMGTDKAVLVVDNETLLERAVGALRAAGCTRVLVVGGEHTGEWELVPDAARGTGPLSALVDGLGQIASDAIALVVACDHPLLVSTELRRLAHRCGADDTDAVIPCVDGRLQPLHAAYKGSCIETLRSAVEQGERSLLGALTKLRSSELRITEVPVESTDPAASSYADVDTPEEFNQIARRNVRS